MTPSFFEDRSRLAIVALTALLALPLVIALVRFYDLPWFPILDHAMTELRVRDVGTANTPLVGLAGRIGNLFNIGSHPGPLSFYLLAPVYRLLGSSPWALQVSCVLLQIAWIAVALVVARRRGALVMPAVGFLIAVLMTGYSFNVLTEPWNPYLPVLPWFVFLLALWSVVSGDVAMLALLVLAGSFCAQTHVPYLALTVALGGVAFAAAIAWWWVRRHDVAERRRVRRWMLVSLVLGVILWMPPTIDQLISASGNYGILIEHFLHPSEPMGGLRAGAFVGVQRLDLWHLIVDQFMRPGILVAVWEGHAPDVVRGSVFLGVWLVLAAVALLARDRWLVTLHAVVAVSVLVGIVTLSRMFGVVWYYLMLWMWGMAVLMALAIGATAVVLVGRRLAAEQRERAGALVGIALVALTALFAGRLSVAATTARHASHLGDIIAPLADATARAIENGVGAADGRDARYLMNWSDTLHMGSQGFTLLNELERRGIHVGVTPPYRVLAPHRAMSAGEATALIVFANGLFIDRYRAVPGAVEVASIDPRSPDERREYESLRTAVLDEIRAASLPDAVIRDVDRNLFAAALAPGIPQETQKRMTRMLELGKESAVFIFPPDFQLPLVP